MSTHDLSRLLRPRSIAVVGGKPAAEVIRQNLRMGYSGALWPLHPKLESIEGLRVYRSPADLPHAPDAVFLAVNRHATIDYVRAFAAMGCGGVVCYAAGFAEAGVDGEGLQATLREAAADMPVLGPNCYGLINYVDGALLWPDQHGGMRVPRGVAIITQSGNIGCNVTMQRRGLPIAYLCTMGNQAVVGLSAAIQSLARDERVTAIGLHIEAIDDPNAFACAVLHARTQGKAVVVLKTGGSEVGASLTISHTASIAGKDQVVDAFLHRVGAARVRSLPVLLETLKLLHMFGPLPGGEIASMSCSGGEAALIADRAEGRRIRFRPLTTDQAGAVRSTLSELVAVTNPLDYHTFSWANAEALTTTFTAMMRLRFDLIALILDFPRTDRCNERDWLTASDSLIQARRATGACAAIIATLPECLPEAHCNELIAAGIAPLLGLDDALDAIEAAATITAGSGPITDHLERHRTIRTLDEARGKYALSAYGVPVPRGLLVGAADDAAHAADELGYPVVLKAISASLSHKSDVGGLRLHLRDATEVRAAADDLLRLSDLLLVERMITGAVAEVIVGINRDPAIGPYLLLGSGGVLAELVGDSSILMIPAQPDEIRTALASLKVSALLGGFRGRPAGDVDALVAVVCAVQRYALANLAELLELEVNPVVVCATGAVAVDVLIRLSEEKE